MNNIIDIYSSVSEEEKGSFKNSVTSKLDLKNKSSSQTYDDTWLTKMEETIKYLDNILRNPNRFIVNEEEVVKIERARRITVESIKHLARNTNFIQKYDPQTGEVTPSKILNINKEESFNTYENRFIYTLINNMKLYIERKKSENIVDSNSHNRVDLNYNGTCKYKNENVSIALNLNAETENKLSKKDDILTRISKIETEIDNLTHQDVYKTIAKLHIMPVTSPIKKTNLILKNVNFQYALDLWNYLQLNMESSAKTETKNESSEGDIVLKKLMDESFLLDYLIVKNHYQTDDQTTKEIQSKVINNTVDRLLSLNSNLSAEELQKLIGDEYTKVKYKKVSDTSIIEEKYKKAIEEYMDKDHNLKVKKDETNK